MFGSDSIIGMGLAGVVTLGLVFFLFVRPFFKPGFEKWLGQLEDAGWFSKTSYKASQGLRVRRGTILGLLILAGCGIYTMMIKNVLGGDWQVDIPFVDDWVLVLLPTKRYTLPLLLGVAALWFAWRVVNYPVFADFLVATEAEINKVSWTTRKRLVQDTIVVLTTVILLALFLLVVDLLWFKILSHPWIKVLQIDMTGQQSETVSDKPVY
jgi:preprotein translocase SecE subunit